MALASLFLFVLLDILGFSLVLPLFPYFTSEYGMSPVEIGLLQTSNAAAQFFAVPVLGSLSDKYGRRPLLILSVFGTLVSFVMLALATSPTMLFASRILDGLLGGNISLAQVYVAGMFSLRAASRLPPHNIGLQSNFFSLDITSESDRTKGMGILGAAFGYVAAVSSLLNFWLTSSAVLVSSLVLRLEVHSQSGAIRPQRGWQLAFP